MGIVVSAAEGTRFSLGFLSASGRVEKAKNDGREKENLIACKLSHLYL